jgi:hypothetical protein
LLEETTMLYAFAGLGTPPDRDRPTLAPTGQPRRLFLSFLTSIAILLGLALGPVALPTPTPPPAQALGDGGPDECL